MKPRARKKEPSFKILSLLLISGFLFYGLAFRSSAQATPLVEKNDNPQIEDKESRKSSEKGNPFSLSEAVVSEEKEVTTEPNLTWGGYLWIDHRAFTRSPQNYSFKEYRLELKAEAKTEKTRWASTLWVRSLGFSSVKKSTDLFVRDKILPFEMEIREAYVDVYGFLFPWLDLRIGRQRIAWGTADRINPTDNLNPDDLEDIWDFGRHLGSDAIKATGYLGQFTLTGVFIPSFTPASPPLPDWAEAFMPSLEINGFNLVNLRDEIILPENNLKSSSIAGLKLSTNFRGYDFSLSYVRGRDDLPLLRDVVVERLSGQEMDVLARLVYPRLNILGFDMAGAVGGVGLWAEGAIFFPERVVGETVFPVPGFGLISQPRIALSNKSYTRFVVGADYTFSNGIYLNGQWAHGFLHERGSSELNDYFLFNLEWRLLRDKLKLVPLAGCVQISEWRNLKNNLALVLIPSFEYHPAANTEIVAGLRILDGRGKTAFGRIKDRDEIFLNFKYSF